MNRYEEYGCKNRKEYLESLAEDYEVPFKIVKMFAEMLGPNEDFDGLINELDDYIESEF